MKDPSAITNKSTTEQNDWKYQTIFINKIIFLIKQDHANKQKQCNTQGSIKTLNRSYSV